MGQRILIIDDEQFLCQTISDYFEDLDFVCKSANNGREGLDAIKDFQPDIVLCDLRMPVVDGFEVLEELSRTQADLPIIVVSGVGLIGDAVKAMLDHSAQVTKRLRDYITGSYPEE